MLGQSRLLTALTPLAASISPLTPLSPKRHTLLMSILNLTPDSFSDGFQRFPAGQVASPVAPIEAALAQYREGAAIVDIGGQSTRPGATPVSTDEEIRRIVPTIRAVANGITPRPAISVDTFSAPVARAALDAGADIINDVSAGQMDPDLLPLVAERGCTVVLNHMRGTPRTMTRLTDYKQIVMTDSTSSYDHERIHDNQTGEHQSLPGDLIAGVRSELFARVKAAESAGVYRWRIILDPGLGFSKTAKQSIELLRRFSLLTNHCRSSYNGFHGLPWMAGPSRKGFIGKVTGEIEPRERLGGTAVAVAAAVQHGHCARSRRAADATSSCDG